MLAGASFVNGTCAPKTQQGSYFAVFATFAFTTFLVLPSIALVIFYGMVIYSLRKRASESGTLGSSSIIEKASLQVSA